jgi:hypothetical protein
LSDFADINLRRQRKQAWEVAPYPCISGFAFLTLGLSKNPQYAAILERLKSSTGYGDQEQKLIDIGCCFGQDVRKLAFDGVSTSQLAGTDLQSELLYLGFGLFRDQDKWSPTAFFCMDIFNAADREKFDIVHIAMFLHLFSRPRQIAACTQIVTKILSSKPGSMIVGSQGGSINPRAVPSRRDPSKETFLHDVQSFKDFWEEVGDKTGTKWRVDAKITKPWEKEDGTSPAEDRYFNGDDMRWLVFTVTRE